MSNNVERSIAEFVDFAKTQLNNNLVQKSKDFELNRKQVEQIRFLIDASLTQTLEKASSIILSNTTK